MLLDSIKAVESTCFLSNLSKSKEGVDSSENNFLHSFIERFFAKVQAQS